MKRFDFNSATVPFRFLLAMTLVIPLMTGCRQPVRQPNGSNSAFDFSPPRIFGGSSGGSIGGSGSRTAANNAFGNDITYQPRTGANPDPLQIQARTPGEYQAYSQLANQLNQLNGRVGAFDQDNQQLHSEVAGLKQKLQLANDYNFQLKQQLADTTGMVNQIQTERAATERRLAERESELNRMGQNLQSRGSQLARQEQQFLQDRDRFASTGSNAGFDEYRGQAQLASATLRANNSLLGRLNDIRIPGGEARMDGDLIRIEFPTDRLFVPGTYEIQPAQMPVIQNLVSTIRQNFPKQIVGIEAHWDNTPLQPSGTTHHQLTATQALAVFNNMVRLGLSPNQLFTMGLGSNRPRHAGGATGNPNRRVEIVIYPESYDGA